ncbi:diphthamide biosynthesis protein [Ramaria rubella]|nr:diphthamide biosynthesis protein [Ramaria rubella]
MADSTTFSSSGEEAITRELNVKSTKRAINPSTLEERTRVDELYEVEWTASEIARGDYKQASGPKIYMLILIALQFPDELLNISVPIYQSLKQRLAPDVGLYVLADTSYGSCCVDEVAAQHINADVIIHYGYSCLSRPSRIPVFYVFSKAPLDTRDAVDSLLKLASENNPTDEAQRLILIPDVTYAHAAGHAFTATDYDFPHCIDELCSTLQESPLLPSDSQVFYDSVPKNAHPASKASQGINHDPPPQSHRRYTLPPDISVSSCIIVYVGPESLGLTNLLMTHPVNVVISYDPTLQPPTARIESARTNRLLMRRYAVVQQARDADVIGILVGTLGVASYLPLLSHIRNLLRRHQKKSYTLSVGKLSPAKLANFAEIECFVMVACPENSVIDAKEFLRPIVTPFELSLALSAEPAWPGDYILDFERVIEHQARSHPNDVSDGHEHDQDRPIFSLVTGKYRHAKRYGEGTPIFSNHKNPRSTSNPSAIILRNTDNALTSISNSAGADFLQERTFRGLEQRLGQDVPSALEKGRSGVARGYQDDHLEEMAH